MKTLCTSLVLAALALTGLAVPTAKADTYSIDFSTYAAVAYSKSTGKYGYAWNHGSRAMAERVALSNCPAADAKIVGWVKGGWIVLAIGDDNSYGVAWEYGEGADRNIARDRALRGCWKHTNRVTRLVMICSGNIAPVKMEFKPGVTPASLAG